MKKVILILVLAWICGVSHAEKPIKMYNTFVVGKFDKPHSYYMYPYRDQNEMILKKYYTPAVIVTWAIVESFLSMNHASYGTQFLVFTVGMNLWLVPVVINEFKYYS